VGDTGVDQTPSWQRPRLTIRRLFGLDRSGPPPPQTLSGAPLNPWTIPNAIGFTRLALIPFFFVIAMSSSDGTGPWPAILFGLIGWMDYADGIAARVTGQYSRLGTLIDPVADRLLIISGVGVCWNFDLLPRWALAVLVIREFATLALARYGMKRGAEVHVNWPGRLAVWPVMTAIFMAFVELPNAAKISLYIGVGLSLWAFALYAREGFAHRRAQKASSSS
jgi:cardiolipin synthase